MTPVRRRLRPGLVWGAAALALIATGGNTQSKVLGNVGYSVAGTPLWAQFRQKFVRSNGAVIDNKNKGISHSEGQGYAMLLAVAAGDRAGFAKIWEFARDKLQVRKDGLFAWRYKHRMIIPVSDKNNASDGDILIAWALMEAAEAGFGDDYRNDAKRIINSIKKLVVDHRQFGGVLLPGLYGFRDKRNGKLIVNPSYWVLPAFERLAELDGSPIWTRLLASTGKIWAASSNNRLGLPADWNAISPRGGKLGPGGKFGMKFSYNAVRLPIYALWSSRPHISFATNIVNNAGKQKRLLISTRPSGKPMMSEYNLRTGSKFGQFSDPGYGAIQELVSCATQGKPLSTQIKTKLDKNYYPAVLQSLSVVVAHMRYPACI